MTDQSINAQSNARPEAQASTAEQQEHSCRCSSPLRRLKKLRNMTLTGSSDLSVSIDSGEDGSPCLSKTISKKCRCNLICFISAVALIGLLLAAARRLCSCCCRR